MNPDHKVKLLKFLRSLRTSESDDHCDNLIENDYHYEPLCRNCIHRSSQNSWCSKLKHYVPANNQRDCFNPTPQFQNLEKLTQPLKK